METLNMSGENVVTIGEDLNFLVGGDVGIPEETFKLITADVARLKSQDQELSSADIPYTLSLRRKDFDTDKELNMFVKSCERLIRTSPEYRVWTDYVREVLGYHSCEITGELHSHTCVDIHHHPFSLWAIVKSEILRRSSSNQEFCSYDISSAIIQLHYELKVSFCLLIRSLHDKFHNGFLQIPMEIVHGDVQHLLQNNLGFLEDSEAETIMSRLNITRANCGWTKGYSWISSNREEQSDGNN